MNGSSGPFSSEIREEEGFVIWVLSGALVVETVPEAKKALEAILEKDPGRVILDFQNLSGMDSVGIGFLVTTQKEIRYRNGRMVLVNVGAHFAALFELALLNRIFEIFLDLETAKRSFGLKMEKKN